jgi:mediator of RNA polymerase II transcription subunit 27
MMQQQSQAAMAVAAAAPGPGPAARAHETAGGDAPPKQVAQAMERLGRAGRIIADIRLGADRLLEALFVAASAPPHSAQQHIERNERVVCQEEVAMHQHFDDLRALGRYTPLRPRAPALFHLDPGASCQLPWVVR